VNLSLILTDSPDIDIVGKLIPNLWAFITQLLAFLVMVFIVIKFAYKPISKYIKGRKEFVKKNLDEAQKANSDALINNQKAQENLDNSTKEASMILLDAKKQADINKENAEKELKQEMKDRRISMEKELEKEKEQALIDAKQEIVDIAINASSSLLKKSVDDSTNRQLVNDYVDSISPKEDK